MLQWIEKYLEWKGIYTSDKFRRTEQFSDCCRENFSRAYASTKQRSASEYLLNIIIYHSLNLGGRSNHGQI